MFFQGRKGQVTVFIIIGIIIVFTFAGVLFLTQSKVKDDLSTSADPIIADISQEFSPIQSYTENCLTQTGKRGLRILGDQGGYIHPSIVAEFSPTQQTDAQGLDLGSTQIPYWHYNSKPNGANEFSFTSHKPSMTVNGENPEMSIESQLARFVNEELATCLQGYQPFIEQGFIISSDEHHETEVTIGESSVNLWLKKNVDASLGDAEDSMDQFFVKLPVKLPRYYRIAQNITDIEAEYNFIERQALELIGIYSGTNPDQLPPVEDETFQLFSTVSWAEAEVKEEVKDLLVSNVPLLRYLGSDNFYRYEYQPTAASVIDYSQLHQKNYDNSILPLEGAEGLDISFDYFGWEPYFDATDKGGSIQPTTVSINYHFLQYAVQHYHTSYDISYPVLVTVTDPSAFNGEGYTFTFALEANIRNSKIVDPERILPQPVAALQQSMVCDQDKRNTQEIRTIVIDSSTKEPIDAVQIGFSIPDQDNCVLGITNIDGLFEEQYPSVLGGIGSYMKEGYLTNFYPIDTYQYQDSPGIIGYAVSARPEPVIELHPYKEVNISVQKKTLQKCIGDTCYGQGIFSGGEEVFGYVPEQRETRHSWRFVNAAQLLTEDETAVITLQRKEDTTPGIYGDDYTTAVTVTGDGKLSARLVPGRYAVTGLVTSEAPITIPKEERCTDGLLGQCYDLAAITLDQSLTGQLSWEDEQYYLDITPEQLYGSEEIVLYVLTHELQNVPERTNRRVIEDLQVAGELGRLSQELRGSLNPVFR